MGKFTPIILIAVSVGIFFVFIDPHYNSVKELNQVIEQNENTIILANKLRDDRDRLRAKFNNISADDKELLRKVLPDTVDNVRLVLDINNIAEDFGIIIDNIGVEGDIGSEAELDNTVVNAGNVGSDFGSIGLSFSVTAEYDNFKAFMQSLEDSLRLVDVTDFTVTASASEGVNAFYNFSVALDTYWLR